MKILVIQGSPDAGSYSHELATAYADEARNAGHDVRMIDLATEFCARDTASTWRTKVLPSGTRRT